MTTRKLSTLKLPHPKYSLDIGKFNIAHLAACSRQTYNDGGHDNAADNNTNSDDDLKLPDRCIPCFSRLCQVVEVRECGNALPRQLDSRIIRDGFLGAQVIIENARPELFLRRDFIKRFVLKGKIFLAHLSNDGGLGRPGYQLTTKGNVLRITMNAKQYRRFGLTANRVIKSPQGGGHLYRVDIDLKNTKIITCNKFQDKLVNTLRRLNPIEKVYFRLVPNEATRAPGEYSLKFFNHVIEEYALDGCQPVPLTGCSAVPQKIQKSWLNCSQSHPPLKLDSIVKNNASHQERRSVPYWSDVTNLTDIVDWLGFQVLSLDCDRDEIQALWTTGENDASKKDRVDVSCVQISGVLDAQHVEESLPKIFDPNQLEGVLLRALILYEDSHAASELTDANLDAGNEDDDAYFDDEDDEPAVSANRLSSSVGGKGIGQTSSDNSNGFYQCGGGAGDANNNSSAVVLLQDCSRGARAADLITIIGMSTLAD